MAINVTVGGDYMHNLAFVPKYHVCPYLALLLTFTYFWPSNVSLITLIDDN